VEHLVEPVGVDVALPRFSWELASSTRGAMQGAYQIVVGTSREAVARGEGDLWDSGRVASGESIDIVYAGVPLPAHARLFWSVKVWDADDQSLGFSLPATFATGFVGSERWQPTWIGFDALRNTHPPQVNTLAKSNWLAHPDDPAGSLPAGARRTFGRSFTLVPGQAIDDVFINVIADDYFELSLNGVALARTEPPYQWRTSKRVALKDALRPGENVLHITVINGDVSASGLLANLQIRYADGTSQELPTDANWSAMKDSGVAINAKARGLNGIKPWGDCSSDLTFLPPVPLLRKTFDLNAAPVRATLYVAVLGDGDLFLNGTRVADERYLSGWTDYKKRVYYRAYDITDRLSAGANAMGVVLADGWYSGHVGMTRKRDFYGKHARFAVELHVELADGTRQVVRTDDTWRAADGPTRSADFLKGEVYDARLEKSGWAAPGFDDTTWSRVDVGTAEVSPQVQWHPAPPVRTFTTIAPQRVTEPTPGTYVIDLGQNIAGVVRLKLRDTKPGQVVTLRHAERLNPDGTLYTINLRSATSVDTYTCRGTAVETWEPRFTFHGFQYVEVSGLSAAPAADTITGVAFSTDTPVTGSFETSDAMLNRLHQNILFTQRANFIDIPTDCPQRDERLGWTADAQIYLNAAMLNADVQAFFDKWLTDLIDAQGPNGEFPMVAPLIIVGQDGGPAWADAGTIVPWTLYEAYGDRRVLERQYPSMKRFVDFSVGRTREGLLPPEKFHCFGDWLNIKDQTPHDLLYSAYLAHSADLTSRAARVLGQAQDAQKYAMLFDDAKAVFQKTYLDAEGKLKGDSQTAYVLAIRFGLLTDTQRAAAAKHLIANVERKGMHLATGFVGTKDLMLVLTDIGRSDVAFTLLHNTTFPSWGFSIEHGATSIWERWDGWTPDKGFQDPGMNSFAHYSFGAVYQWMVENIGGIHATVGAAKQITVAPHFDPTLTWANVSYHSPRGMISTKWKREGDALVVNITIPANVRATITLPTTPTTTITESGDSLESANGLNLLKRDSNTVHIEAGGGTYRFVIR
jgi:alpha-L-rhamnosidase